MGTQRTGTNINGLEFGSTQAEWLEQGQALSSSSSL